MSITRGMIGFIVLLVMTLLCRSGMANKLHFPNSVRDLVKAMVVANADHENNIIDLGQGVFRIDTVNNTTENGNNGLPVVLPDPSVISPHSVIIKNGTIEIDLFSGQFLRHFEVAVGATLILENVKLQFGSSSVNGGSIFNSGAVSTEHVAFVGNQAGGDGGAIFNNAGGILNINDTTFNLNVANGSEIAILCLNMSAITGGGGAIYNEGTISRMFNSTFANNTTSGNGGAINNINGFINAMTNNTVAGNSAAIEGGGIYNTAASCLLQTASTIQIFVSNIVAANTATGGADICDDLANILNPQYNLVGITGIGSLNYIYSTGNNVVGTVASPLNPGLEELHDNGGKVWTMALALDSLAINAGYNWVPLRFDERGADRTSGGATDIGAYEAQLTNP